MSKTITKEVALVTNATIAADGYSAGVTCDRATKVSVYVDATLGGTTPSLQVFLQTKDANGNWHDVGSGTTAITATGTTKEVGITGPFGSAFRVRYDVDVASGNETYTNVDVSLHFERNADE